jgi:hypothetical protein
MESLVKSRKRKNPRKGVIENWEKLIFATHILIELKVPFTINSVCKCVFKKASYTAYKKGLTYLLEEVEDVEKVTSSCKKLYAWKDDSLSIKEKAEYVRNLYADEMFEAHISKNSSFNVMLGISEKTLKHENSRE